MNALLRALPVTALLCTVGCDVDDDTVTRVGDGVIGVGLQADIDEVELDPIDDLVSATHPTFACSEGAWTPAWITLEDQVLTLVNQKRAAGATCGGVVKPPVAALTSNAKLRCAARVHAKDMATQNYFSHTSLNGTQFYQRITNAGYTWTQVAENIAAGQATAASVVAGWMASTGHCNNIMNGALKNIGVGYAYNVNASYDHYWVQDFGKP